MKDMQFTSIGEYFYKCYSVVMIIVLIPIVAFTALYLRPASTETPFVSEPDDFVLLTAGVLVCWLTVFLFSNKKIKTVRNHQGLRKKLDKYFELTIVRFFLLALTGVVLAIGFLLSRNDYFSIFFVLNLLMNILFWPSPKKVSRELRLRGDEREMVYFKRDVLS
jgi:hypothetical protein